MPDQTRVLHIGADRYVLVARGAELAGERLRFPQRDLARSFVSKLAADTQNRETLREASKLAGETVPKSEGGRPDEGETAPLIDAIARGSVEVVRLIDHPVSPVIVRTTGTLTLSEVSWGETSGIYPSRDNLYRPDKWDQEKLGLLLRARAAVTDVAKRNSDVRKAKPRATDKIEQMMRPYHCTENFPVLDKEIGADVCWFYLSTFADKPTSHPGAARAMVIAKSYGPFYNIGGGDVPRGTVYLHFYKLA
ncbi:MAG: hypothetical protein U0441_10135 [Polyangiaceae bacterium]